MSRILVHDVGDGNHIDLLNSRREANVKVDFGTSSERSRLFSDSRFNYWFGPYPPFFYDSQFILSHYHTDHYNGFVEALHNPKHKDLEYRFEEVYYPVFPTFPSSNLIMKEMSFINRLMIGDFSGSQQYDLLRLISKKNGQPFEYAPVHQGSTIQSAAGEIKILWPPPRIADEGLTRDVSTALLSFEEFILEHDNLRERYERMNSIPLEPGTFVAEDDDKIEQEMADGELAKSIHKVDVALNKVANRISIAFMIEDRMLFLGDLLEEEILEVTKYLKYNYKFNHTECLVAAHHGTHWDDSLNNIFAYCVVISNGRKMIRHFREEYKGIAGNVRATFQEGDVAIDNYLRLTNRCSCPL